jgi:hypothetical protein
MKAAASPSTGKTGTHPTASRGDGHAEHKAAAASITPEQLHQMIAEQAYLLAERRGFQNGDPTSDWLAAEGEVTRRLTRNLEQPSKR